MLVLSVATIATTVAIGAMTISTTQRRTTELEFDYQQAGQLVESSIDLALGQLADRHDWRTAFEDFQNSGFSPRVRMGRGAARWQLFDPLDSNIANQDSDHVRIVGQAKYRNSRRQFSVMAVQDGRALDCLRTAVHASGDIAVRDDLIVGNGPVSANGVMDLSNARVFGAVEAGMIVSPGHVVGSALDSAPAKTMPSRLLFEMYRTMASELKMDGLSPVDTLTGQLNRAFNPAVVPLDGNADGIYSVDVEAGRTLTIKDCRITGTILVKLNGANARLSVGSGVIWKPGRPGLPSLIVYTESDLSNTVEIQCKGSLTEAMTTSDAELQGVFHVIRNVPAPVSLTSVNAEHPIHGCIVADGDLEISGSSHLVADWNLTSHPPLGYTTAIDSENRLTNGTFDDGLCGWCPAGESYRGAGTRLEIISVGGDNAMRVSNRALPSAGVFQDVTRWIRSGETIAGKIDLRTETSDELFRIQLEWLTQDGSLHTASELGTATTSGATIAFSFVPSWIGKLENARLLITGTESGQAFVVDNAIIADSREQKPSNLVVVPSTWRLEPFSRSGSTSMSDSPALYD